MSAELSCLARETFNWTEAKREFERLLVMDRNSQEFVACFRQVDEMIQVGMEIEKRED